MKKLETIKAMLEELQPAELWQVHDHIVALLQPKLLATDTKWKGHTVDTESKCTHSPAIVYQQESVNCGKANCTKCAKGEGHGPYWYAYYTERGRTKSVYIGKKWKPLTEKLGEQAKARKAKTTD